MIAVTSTKGTGRGAHRWTMFGGAAGYWVVDVLPTGSVMYDGLGEDGAMGPVVEESMTRKAVADVLRDCRAGGFVGKRAVRAVAS